MTEKSPEEKMAEIEKRRKEVAALLAFGEYTEEMRRLEDTAETKKFSEIFSVDNQTLTTYVPELKCNINYKQLSWKDIVELHADFKDDTERGREVIYRMIKAADETITKESFQQLTPETLSYIVGAITRKTPIFLPLKLQDESKNEMETGGT